MPTTVKQKKRWVVAKGDLYANVNHTFGGRPKVFNTMRAAQYDIDNHRGLRGGVIKPYTGQEVVKTPGFATTDPAKVAGAPAKPRRAADGLVSATGATTKPAIKPKGKPQPKPVAPKAGR
jgi:hypothetical protein